MNFFSIFSILSTLYSIVNAITTGQELTKSVHFSVGNQSFNLNVEGELIPKAQQPVTPSGQQTGTHLSGVVKASEATATVVSETPAQLMEQLLADIATLEFSPVGTPIELTYSYLIDNAEYVNATITLTRVS